MFVGLLFGTLLISIAVCFVAIYVVGISGGVRVYSLEQYVNPRSQDQAVPELTASRWALEAYRTIIETLQGIAWMLLVVFVFALIAYVILRGFELRQAKQGKDSANP